MWRFIKNCFWDARATSLEEQMIGPLYSPEEMGTTRETTFKDHQSNRKLSGIISASSSK